MEIPGGRLWALDCERLWSDAFTEALDDDGEGVGVYENEAVTEASAVRFVQRIHAESWLG